MRNWTLKQAYLYLVSFVSLMILIAGLINTIMAVADLFTPKPYFSPGPAEVYLRYSKLEGGAQIPKEIIEEQLAFEKARERENQLASVYQNVKRGLAYLVVALPVWLYHWKHVRLEG